MALPEKAGNFQVLPGTGLVLAGQCLYGLQGSVTPISPSLGYFCCLHTLFLCFPLFSLLPG